MLSLESTSSRMNRLAKQELRFGAFFSLDEMLGAIDRVSSGRGRGADLPHSSTRSSSRS